MASPMKNERLQEIKEYRKKNYRDCMTVFANSAMKDLIAEVERLWEIEGKWNGLPDGCPHEDGCQDAWKDGLCEERDEP